MKKVLFAASMLAFVACGNGNKKISPEDAKSVDSTAVTTAACCTEACTGKVWSELYQDSISIAEKATKVISADSAKTYAFVVFAQDSLKCELHLKDNSYVLERRGAKDSFVWNEEDDDTHNVRFVDGALEISQRGNVVFKEEQKNDEE